MRQVDANAAADALSAINDASAPYASVHDAVAALRAVPRGRGHRGFVVLREGTHYLGRTLELGPEDSHVSFVNFPGEAAAMSGAMPITTDWKPHRLAAADGATDIYVADLSSQKITAIPGLRVDGKGGVRTC